MAPPKTYILIGDDYRGAQSLIDNAKGRDDIIVIQAEQGKSLEQSMTGMHGPCNVIVACHGDDKGNFRWHKDEPVISYQKLFDELPRETLSIGSYACFGEKAITEAHAPNGALVYAMVSDKVIELETETEAVKLQQMSITPVNLLLATFKAVDPAKSVDLTEVENKISGIKVDIKTEQALSTWIRIGKTPLNLERTVASIGTTKDINSDAFAEAVKTIKEQFGGGQKSDERIAHIADKMLKGQKLNGVEENRIAYALAVSYLDKSGTIEQLQQLDKQKRQNFMPDGLEIVTLPRDISNEHLVTRTDDLAHLRTPEVGWNQVKGLKQALNAAGFHLNADDRLDDVTLAAIKRVAQKAGIKKLSYIDFTSTENIQYQKFCQELITEIQGQQWKNGPVALLHAKEQVLTDLDSFLPLPPSEKLDHLLHDAGLKGIKETIADTQGPGSIRAPVNYSKSPARH